MTAPKITFSFLVKETNEYGTRKLEATIVYKDAKGELLSPLGSWTSDPGYELADFRVYAYLGGLTFMGHAASADDARVWGCSVGYNPNNVETAERAEAMAKVLRKITKGMAKLRDEQGYLAESDFAGYLLRIATVLRIRTFYLPMSDKQREMTGQRWNYVTATGLQGWIQEQERLMRKRLGVDA